MEIGIEKILERNLNAYTYPNRRIVKYDEIPSLSQEWLLRIGGLHEEALFCHNPPSLLDYAATREEKAFWRGDWL